MKTKIAYICHFSTPQIREKLQLKSLFWTNILRRVVGFPKLEYCDGGTWNADFIKAFENNEKYDCFVVEHHLGLVNKEQRFQMNNVNYIILQETRNFMEKIKRHLFKSKPLLEYDAFVQQISRVVDKLNPDVVVLCGAENSIYSPSVLQLQYKPIFVLLQTLLNSPKRVAMMQGDYEGARRLENNIIKHANYFGTIEMEELEYINKNNPNANCLKLMFPLSDPEIDNNKVKEYDFVFFANGLSKHKGTEDALRGFIKVYKKYPQATFNVVGKCGEEYRIILNSILEGDKIKDNVTFIEHFPLKADVLKHITKAKFVVLPSITAALNSTVREAMYLGLPTIVYETSVTKVINQHDRVLLEARMEDVDDLAAKMIYAYEHPSDMLEMAKKAKLYAINNFSAEAVAKTLEEDVAAIINHYYHQVPIPQELLLV